MAPHTECGPTRLGGSDLSRTRRGVKRLPMSTGDYHQLVERVRQVRARSGDRAPRAAPRVAPPPRSRSQWSVVVAVWVLSFAAPLLVSLHLRAALARHAPLIRDAPARPPVASLVGDWLLHGLPVAPLARLSAAAG